MELSLAAEALQEALATDYGGAICDHLLAEWCAANHPPLPACPEDTQIYSIPWHGQQQHVLVAHADCTC